MAFSPMSILFCYLSEAHIHATMDDTQLFRMCSGGLAKLHERVMEQAETIKSLHKSNDEMSVLISSQEYTIKKLSEEIADLKESQRQRNPIESLGVAELAKFEDEVEAEDLLEKMRRRKELLSMTPVDKARANIREYVTSLSSKADVMPA